MGVRRCKIETPRTPSCSASPVVLELVRPPKGFTPRRQDAKEDQRPLAPKAPFGCWIGASRLELFLAPWRRGVKIFSTRAALRFVCERERLGVSTMQRWGVP